VKIMRRICKKCVKRKSHVIGNIHACYSKDSHAREILIIHLKSICHACELEITMHKVMGFQLILRIAGFLL